MKKIKQKNIFAKLLFIAVVFNFIFFGVPQASAWETWLTIPMGVMMDNVLVTIKGVGVGIAKKAALKALDAKINFFINGSSSGGSMYITKWDDFLIIKPTNSADIKINAIIDQALSGRGSLKGYVSAGSEGFGSNASYKSQLAQGTKRSMQKTTCKNNYEGEPVQMFASGNFRNFNLYLAGNDPWSFSNCIGNERYKAIEENKLIAQTKAISPGFKGKENATGETETPAGLIGSQVMAVKNAGVDVITNCQDFGCIMTSVVNEVLVSSFDGVNKQNSSRGRETDTMKKSVNTNGPGELYKSPTFSGGGGGGFGGGGASGSW